MNFFENKYFDGLDNVKADPLSIIAGRRYNQQYSGTSALHDFCYDAGIDKDEVFLAMAESGLSVLHDGVSGGVFLEPAEVSGLIRAYRQKHAEIEKAERAKTEDLKTAELNARRRRNDHLTAGRLAVAAEIAAEKAAKEKADFDKRLDRWLKKNPLTV